MCREGIFAVLEALGWRAAAGAEPEARRPPRASPAVGDCDGDNCVGSTASAPDDGASALDGGASAFAPRFVELTDEDASSGACTSSSSGLAPSPSLRDLCARGLADGRTKLDAYRMELVRSSFLFSSSFMMSLALYYYWSFVV